MGLQYLGNQAQEGLRNIGRPYLDLLRQLLVTLASKPGSQHASKQAMYLPKGHEARPF
jgi:hypothetical protein